MLSYDRKIALIFIGAAAAVFVTLQAVALLLMAIARRLPHARAHGAAARHRQHPPAGRADADRRAVARARPGAARHRDPDRRQPAAADRRRAAGQGAVVLLPRHPVGRIRRASTPSSASRRRTPRSSACRCCAAASCRPNGIKADDIKAQPNAAWVLQSDRGITFAAEVPRGSTVVEGELVAAGLQRAAAGFVREEDRRRARPQDRRSDRGQRARPQHRRRSIANLRSVHWENLGINFVLVFSPNAFAGAPHTDIATLTYPGGGTADAGNRAAQGGGRRVSGGHHRARQGCDRGGRRHRAQSRCSRCAAPAWWRWSPRCWCSAARSPPVTLPGLRRGRAQDARRHARQADRRLRAGIPAARHRRPRCSAWRPARSRPGWSSRR